MEVNKIVYGNKVLIDLTLDTVTPDVLLPGYTAHDNSGQIINGNCPFDANTQDATANASDILSGQTAYVKGSKVTGTMINNGKIDAIISALDDRYTIPVGYHNGLGTVGIDPSEKSKLIPSNIKSGVTILGVTGTNAGAIVNAQSKTVTSSTVTQTVTPDSGYTHLTDVIVNPIPYVETDNASGGITVTIG